MKLINILGKQPLDRILIIIFMLLLLVYSFMPNMADYVIISIFFGSIFLLFLPGYTLLIFLFPKNEDVDPILRWILSIIFSITMLSFLAILLSALKIPLFNPVVAMPFLNPIFIALFILIIALLIGGGVIRYFADRELPGQPTFSGRLRSIIHHPENKTNCNPYISILLIIFILCLITGTFIIYNNLHPGPETQFYILNAEGKAIDYPSAISENETSTVIVGITNHENTKEPYILTIGSYENLMLEKTIVLDNNENWERQIALSDYFKNFTEKQRIQFNLYKEKISEEPYRSLHIWITKK